MPSRSIRQLMDRLNRPVYRIGIMVLLGALALCMLWPRERAFRPIDRAPNSCGQGRVHYAREQMTLRVSGPPEALGEQHGRLLKASIRRMLDGYIRETVCGRSSDTLERLLARVRAMKPALPDWYLNELSACARAAGVDEDELLLAQCEGDILSLQDGDESPRPACSAYVVFGRPNIADGKIRVGRNFDYAAGDFVRNCALTTYVTPRAEDGYPFVAVGWSGVLGGWTLVNSRGLVVANHLGGGSERDPHGIPTLVLTRILAQKAGSIDEALDIVRSSPRMRGQIVWLAQPADERTDRPARAVAVEYDAREAFVREAEDGVLIVSNQNLVFGGKLHAANADPLDSVHSTLSGAIDRYTGPSERLITEMARPDTLHCVEVDFSERRLYVAHGRFPAHSGDFVAHELPK